MSEFLAFLASHRLELAARLGEHVVLVALSTAVAAALGVPLGILAARRPGLARPLLALANVAQTIPSLALFGFLIPLPFVGGIGTRTALVALSLYAVLPIVRMTIVGLQSIDRAVLECATAMGMAPRQILRRIELPLAAPSIVAGIRVAVVVGVGTATIASAIGAGGLGDYIFRGLAMVDPVVILAGALPAALLALGCDALLAWAARAVSPRTRPRRALSAAAAASAAAVLVASALCTVQARADIVIGSKNFTEQVILGELIAQAVERETDLTVERRFNLGGTLVCDEALRRGDIDLYVEYTGTALTALFDEPVGERSRVFERVRGLYAARGVTVMPGLGFDNTFAVLVRARDAREHGLTTISDLARVARTWRAGVGYEFLERPDGLAGLAARYGLAFREPPRVMDLNLIYRALASGEIDVTAGDATSGLIAALDLTALADDRQYFPPYDAVPVVRTATLLRHPDLDRTLRSLAGRISAADMRRMNYAVDGLRRDPREVAAEFLTMIDRHVP